jgi:hypothetical protein
VPRASSRRRHRCCRCCRRRWRRGQMSTQIRCHRWPRRSSLRDDDRPGGFSRPGGRARGGCRASGPIRKFTRAFAARTRGRVDVTASGCDPRRQRGLRPARCRRRGQGQYLGACARWRGRRSRCSSAPPSHCAWPPGPPVQAVHCRTRAGARVVSATRTLRARRRRRCSICRWLAHGTHSASRSLLVHHHRRLLPPP